MNVYATIDEIKLYLGGGLEEGEESKDDILLLRFAVKASRMFDKFATNGVMPMRHFYPTIATKDFDHPEDTDLLLLKDDLLEVTTFTTKNGAITITAADYELMTANGRYNQTPYSRIQMHPDGTQKLFEFNGTSFAANQLVGAWGFHDNWAEAWEDSGDTVTDGSGIDATVTTITVDDADGDDINGIAHRFKHQQLLKIESEYLWVTDVDVTANTLTVRRGMNGSTAATHAQTTAISIFRPMDDVVEAMEELTTFIYHRKDTLGTRDDFSFMGNEGQLIIPSTLPETVKSILRPHRKEAL